MHEDGRSGQREKGRVADMTVSTAQTEPAKRPRRRMAAVLALLFLLIGGGLLWYSFFWQAPLRTASAGPSPTTTRSPIALDQTVAATPSPGATAAPVVIVTTFVVVPTFANPPASSAQDSDTLALVTTVSGLLASLAGIVSAVVSMRGNRSR